MESIDCGEEWQEQWVSDLQKKVAAQWVIHKIKLDQWPVHDPIQF